MKRQSVRLISVLLLCPFANSLRHSVTRIISNVVRTLVSYRVGSHHCMVCLSGSSVPNVKWTENVISQPIRLFHFVPNANTILSGIMAEPSSSSDADPFDHWQRLIGLLMSWKHVPSKYQREFTQFICCNVYQLEHLSFSKCSSVNRLRYRRSHSFLVEHKSETTKTMCTSFMYFN